MVPGARLIILGKQGAGKGTQCVRLARHYVVPHISTGDMFRAALRSGSHFGMQLNLYMSAGQLVPDEVVIGVVKERLEQHDTLHRGFLLDGFPRTAAQAEGLSKLLAPDDIDLAIDLEIPTELSVKRLLARRVCETCGTNYSTEAPPRSNWTCDVCGGHVERRADDTAEGISERLRQYEIQTEPLIAWFLERDKLVQVDGEGSPDEVTARIIRAIDRRRGIG